MKSPLDAVSKVFRFYLEGFRNMPGWGRRVWLIILVKLFIMFFILRLFFFPDFLKSNFRDDMERSNYIRDHLIKSGDQ